ncbi:MAG: ATP-binding protein [Nocardioidaceae bacterium]
MRLRDRLSARVSLASRVTMLATVAVGLTLAVVSVAVYLTVRMQLVDSLDESLLRRAYAAAEAGFADSGVVGTIPPATFAAADIKIAVMRAGEVESTPDGEAARPYVGPMEWEVAGGDRGHSIRTVNISGTEFRVVAVGAGPGTALVLAQSLQPTHAVLERLGVVFWVVGIGGMLVAGAAGWVVASNSLRPIRRLTAAAEQVARTQQLTPIEVTGDDELARLTVAFNSMLIALDASQHRQRQLVADAGHELRTPLTSLRTNIDLLTQSEGGSELTPHARKELLADAHAQVEELSTLVGDLVELARDEPLVRNPEPTDLAQLVASGVERVRRRAMGVDFDVETQPWLVVGEAQLLERAITNLLDNAAKWSPPGGTVTVRLLDGELTVADQGRGISEEDLPHVFERFYRSREARTLPGSGLGLAIVQQTANRHGGTVSARHSPGGGAEFALRLPGEPVTAAPVAVPAAQQ